MDLNVDHRYTEIAKRHSGIIDRVFSDDEFVAVRYQSPETSAFECCIRVIRRDRQPIKDWRVLQEVKNRIATRDHEAVLVFPAESRGTSPVNEYELLVRSLGSETRPRDTPVPPPLTKLYTEVLAPMGA